MTTEVQVTKEKRENLEFLRIKTSCATKDIITGVITQNKTPLADTGMAVTSQSHTAGEDVGNLGSSYTGVGEQLQPLRKQWRPSSDSRSHITQQF